MQKKIQCPLSLPNPVAFGWTKRPIDLSGELHPYCFFMRNCIQNHGIQPERHKQHAQKRIPPSLSTLQHHYHRKSVPVPFYRVKRTNWRDREIGRRREEKSSHLAGHDLKDFASEIQSIFNISPNSITLKSLHRCSCTAAASEPEPAKGSFATRRRRKLSGFLQIPWLGNFTINVDKSQKSRREENRLLFFSQAEQQTWAERQNNWLSMLFLFSSFTNFVNTFKIRL